MTAGWGDIDNASRPFGLGVGVGVRVGAGVGVGLYVPPPEDEPLLDPPLPYPPL